MSTNPLDTHTHTHNSRWKSFWSIKEALQPKSLIFGQILGGGSDQELFCNPYINLYKHVCLYAYIKSFKFLVTSKASDQ